MKVNNDENHVHTFERMKVKTGRKDMYRCLHPNCTFYAPISMIIGKFALCKLCFNKFVLTKDSLRLKVPHCGCRALTPEQREKLRGFGTTADEQAAVALQILENQLRKGM